MNLRRWWKLYRIRRELRRYSPLAREMSLAAEKKRSGQGEIPKELIEKAKAIVGGLK